ncbi:hypothetical protein FBY06_101213 [Pseudomonas sp. SJZ085]|nr:hypothetical protein FBX99_101213 [Pseudomonas sp. SJZ074]TWC42486.1 hypothetical protein FBY06_101213 [Pseudomonas sp. SJZ085]
MSSDDDVFASDEPGESTEEALGIQIISPSGYVPERSFLVSGVGARPNSQPIELFDSSNNQRVGYGYDINPDGSWSVQGAIPNGSETLTYYAHQTTVGPSRPKTVSTRATTLVRPLSNALLSSNQVVFGGECFAGNPGMLIRVLEESTEMASVTVVEPATTWEARPTVFLSSRTYTVRAEYSVQTSPVLSYTPYVSFRVVGLLLINPTSSDQEMRFTLAGSNGVAGAKVEVKVDFAEITVGEGSVATNGSWTAEVQVPAGPISLVAEQIYQNVRSQRSSPASFKIKPPKPTNIQITYPSPGTVRFSGTGYPGATVDVHIANNNTPQASGEVRDGGWVVDWSDQPPARHEMNIRQKLADGSSWIYSDWSDRLTVSIPVPVPTLTSQVGTDRKPVFSGTGHRWEGQPAAQIEVRREGEQSSAAPIVAVRADNGWTTTATQAWDPGIYRVQAWQLFKELSSAPSTTRSFTIPAPLPTVEVRQDGLTPHFSGTCLNGAQVKLGFDGEQGTPHDAIVSGTTWTFTRTEPFTPGPHGVSVTQALGGQTSNAATLAFDVVGSRPIITAPIDVEVDHNPVVTGTGGIPGARIQVFEAVTDSLLGEASVTQNEWSVRLEDLALRTYCIYAVQIHGEPPFEPSDPVSFTVILFPPTIDHPQPGDKLARNAVIDGYARKALEFDTAQVELWLGGEFLDRVKARGVDGYWIYEHALPVGDYVLRAKQLFADKESVLSPDHAFTVIPALPIIESPIVQQHTGSRVTLSGFGYAGDWVEVAWSDAPDTLLGRAQVQGNRTWSLPLSLDRPAGPQHWVVQQESEGYRSGWSEPHEVLQLSSAPTFTAPEAGHWFADMVLFAGTGETGKRIELSQWFDSRRLVSQGDSVTDGTWSASPDAPLQPGAHWVKARQNDSDWGDSLRFEVARTGDSGD